MMEQQTRFQVDLRGIIELLSQHLYSSPDVFVRELLQNAIDAHTARRELEPGHRGQVRMELSRPRGSPPTLTVEDDGIGLAEEEMHAFLATIGASSKRGDLARRRGEFLGQFGIGLLSCFLVSDEIVVVSQSARAQKPAVEWRGRASGTYSVRRLDRQLTPGTRVYLRATADGKEHLKFETLAATARRYGEMLEMDITLTEGSRTERINREAAPWQLAGRADRRSDTEAYCLETFGWRPLDVIPIGFAPAGLSGAAFVVPESTSAGRAGVHRVYQRGMFVLEGDTGLVPEWAFFVHCVLNTTRLKLTASRESLMENAAMERARDHIATTVKDHLVRMAHQNPGRFAELLSVHDVSLRALAVDDDEFFGVVADLLPFETSLGRMTLGEYRRENSTLRVAPTAEQFRQIATIAAAQSVCVFNGGYSYHSELLHKAATLFEGLEWLPTSASELVLEFAEPSEAEHAQCFEFLRTADAVLEPFKCRADLRRFEPSTVPALYASSLGAVLYRSMEQTRELADSHWGGVLASLQDSRPAPRVELCFNLSCPLVVQVVGLADRRLQVQAIRVLYVQALLLGQHALSRQELNLLSESMEGLLRFAVEQARPG